MVLLAVFVCGGIAFSHFANADDEERSHSDGGRHRNGSGWGGFGVSVDVGQIISLFGQKPKTQEKKDTNGDKGGGDRSGVSVPKDDIVGVGDNDTFVIGDNEEVQCHCQGGRLLIVMGNFTDPTIAFARTWSQGLAKGALAGSHLHVVSYSAPPGSDPEFSFPFVPDDKAPGGWKKLEHVVHDSKKDQTLPNDCCYFDEVMIMFHGHQAGGWSKLIQYLPSILNHRPVKKLVLWSCRSSKVFYPKSTKSTGEIYEKVCGIVRPKDCPCQCEHLKCQAKDADGKPAKCPRKTQTVTILAAGQFRGRATNIGIDDTNPANPLTSPDGTLREINVAGDGTITATLTGAGPQVFGPHNVRPKGTPGKEEGEKFEEGRHLKDSKVTEIEPKKPYSGPMACAGKEGCIPEAVPKGTVNKL